MSSRDKPQPRALDLDAAVAGAADASRGEAPLVSMQIQPGEIPANAPEPLKRWAASVRRGRPAIAILEEKLPNGAIARVVRDPGSEFSRLLIVSRQDVDDEVLALAENILQRSEMNQPDLVTARTITVWRDRRVVVSEGEKEWSGTYNYTWLMPAGKRGDADRLLQRGEQAATIRIAGLGSARMIPASGPLKPK